jgi:hypothetical protein
VVHANIHRLPIEPLAASWAARRGHNLEKNPVDPGSTGHFPWTTDEFVVLGRYLRSSLRGTKDQPYGEKARGTKQAHLYRSSEIDRAITRNLNTRMHTDVDRRLLA